VCPPFQEFRVNRQRHSTNHELRVVFCYAAVRLFFAKREAAASPISGNAVEDQSECRAYFICDAASKGTHANEKKLKCAQAGVTHRARQRAQGGGRSRRRSIYCVSSQSQTCAAVQRLRSRGYACEIGQEAKAQRFKLKRASSRRSGSQQTWPWTGPTVQRELETLVSNRDSLIF